MSKENYLRKFSKVLMTIGMAVNMSIPSIPVFAEEQEQEVIIPLKVEEGKEKEFDGEIEIYEGDWRGYEKKETLPVEYNEAKNYYFAKYLAENEKGGYIVVRDKKTRKQLNEVGKNEFLFRDNEIFEYNLETLYNTNTNKIENYIPTFITDQADKKTKVYFKAEDEIKEGAFKGSLILENKTVKDTTTFAEVQLPEEQFELQYDKDKKLYFAEIPYKMENFTTNIPFIMKDNSTKFTIYNGNLDINRSLNNTFTVIANGEENTETNPTPLKVKPNYTFEIPIKIEPAEAVRNSNLVACINSTTGSASIYKDIKDPNERTEFPLVYNEQDKLYYFTFPVYENIEHNTRKSFVVLNKTTNHLLIGGEPEKYKGFVGIDLYFTKTVNNVVNVKTILDNVDLYNEETLKGVYTTDSEHINWVEFRKEKPINLSVPEAEYFQRIYLGNFTRTDINSLKGYEYKLTNTKTGETKVYKSEDLPIGYSQSVGGFEKSNGNCPYIEVHKGILTEDLDYTIQQTKCPEQYNLDNGVYSCHWRKDGSNSVKLDGKEIDRNIAQWFTKDGVCNVVDINIPFKNTLKKNSTKYNGFEIFEGEVITLENGTKITVNKDNISNLKLPDPTDREGFIFEKYVLSRDKDKNIIAQENWVAKGSTTVNGENVSISLPIVAPKDNDIEGSKFIVQINKCVKGKIEDSTSIINTIMNNCEIQPKITVIPDKNGMLNFTVPKNCQIQISNSLYTTNITNKKDPITEWGLGNAITISSEGKFISKLNPTQYRTEFDYYIRAYDSTFTQAFTIDKEALSENTVLEIATDKEFKNVLGEVKANNENLFVIPTRINDFPNFIYLRIKNTFEDEYTSFEQMEPYYAFAVSGMNTTNSYYWNGKWTAVSHQDFLPTGSTDFSPNMKLGALEIPLIKHTKEKPKEYTLVIKKKDIETDKLISYTGAKFKVYKYNGNCPTRPEEKPLSIKVGSNTYDTFITKNSTSVSGSNTEFYGTDEEGGTVKTPLKLQEGEYVLEEIQAPKGYSSVGQIHFVVGEESTNNEFYNTNSSVDKDGNAIITVEVKNKPIKQRIAFRKTVKQKTEKKYDLSEIEYEIVAKNDVVDFTTGAVIAKAGEVLQTLKGVVLTKEIAEHYMELYNYSFCIGNFDEQKPTLLFVSDYLPEGEYTLRETKTCEGLDLDKTDHSICVKYGNFSYIDTTGNCGVSNKGCIPIIEFVNSEIEPEPETPETKPETPETKPIQKPEKKVEQKQPVKNIETGVSSANYIAIGFVSVILLSVMVFVFKKKKK